MAAIATKKRLYAKALDSLASTSQTSLPVSDTVAKRPLNAIEAFDEARERAKKRLRHSTSTGSLPPTIVPSPASTPRKDAAAAKSVPNYAPWSHDAFLARLKTFSSVSLWHPKPESISEVEWAKRGWVCADVNTVRCKGGCEKRVVVSLDVRSRKANVATEGAESDADEDEEEESALEQALADKYKDMIVDGHAENCLWRKGGCKDDIYHLSIARASVWQPELRTRYQTVAEIAHAVENVGIVSPPTSNADLESSERLLQDLPPILLGETTIELTPAQRVRALDVALHGWRGSRESGSELLHCDACFQRIGLWMYQPDYRPSRSTTEDDDIDNALTLDLAELHREHCPWRNPTTQKASGNLSGLNACQILRRIVSAYARDQRRRSDEEAGLGNGQADEGDGTDAPVYSKEEIAKQDKERESRMRKLKSLFSIKRRSKSVPKASTK